jgi:hypothetical protein
VAELAQAAFTDRGVRTGTGAIDMHPCGGQVINPNQVLVESRFQGGPPRVITQASQHDFETVIGKINARNRLTSRDAKCPKPCGHPGFDMHQTVVPSGQHGAEPDRAHPAQAETCPVAVGGKMGV